MTQPDQPTGLAATIMTLLMSDGDAQAVLAQATALLAEDGAELDPAWAASVYMELSNRYVEIGDWPAVIACSLRVYEAERAAPKPHVHLLFAAIYLAIHAAFMLPSDEANYSRINGWLDDLVAFLDGLDDPDDVKAGKNLARNFATKWAATSC